MDKRDKAGGGVVSLPSIVVASLFILCAVAPTLGSSYAEKIYIDNGLVSYCYSPKVSDAAVELHLYDIASIEIHKCYLPGTVYPREYDNEPMLHFPLAWSTRGRKLTIIFPDRMSSAGTSRCYAWASEDTSNLGELQKAHLRHHYGPENVIVQDGVMRYRVRPSVVEYVVLLGTAEPWDEVKEKTKLIWYDMSDEHIIMRFPLAQREQESWLPCESPVAFRWAEMSLRQAVFRWTMEECVKWFKEETSFQEGDFEPSGSIKLSGKRSLSDNGQVQFPEGVDWLIWGTDGEGKPKLCTMREGKLTVLEGVKNFAIPKAVVVNNDSNYVMFLYQHSVDPADVKASFEKILGYLRQENELIDYARRRGEVVATPP